MVRLLFFIFGYTRYYVKGAERALNLLLRSEIPYFYQRKENDGISFCTLFIYKKRIKKLFLSGGAEIIHTEDKGLVSIISRYKKRVGIALGVLIFLFLTLSSERLIWKIDIKGNVKVTDKRILSLLEEKGVYEGGSSKGIDTYRIANECLIDCKELSYMSINVIGSCAEVVVMEKKDSEKIDITGDPSSIVASRSGRITEIEVFSGDALVSVGDTVFEGQTLVSGIYSYRDDRFALVRSVARIYAETVREFSVRVDYSENEKRLKESKTVEKSIIFFRKEIKILKNSGKSISVCDTIERRERIMLFGRIALPIYIRTVSEQIYEECETVRDKSESLALAKKRMGEILSGYELLSFCESFSEDERGIVYKVVARVNEEISREIGMIKRER